MRTIESLSIEEELELRTAEAQALRRQLEFERETARRRGAMTDPIEAGKRVLERGWLKVGFEIERHDGENGWEWNAWDDQMWCVNIRPANGGAWLRQCVPEEALHVYGATLREYQVYR